MNSLGSQPLEGGFADGLGTALLTSDCDITAPPESSFPPREGQQKTAAAYLSALLRGYARDDETALPYLTGERIVEGPEIFGVTGIEVEYQG